MVLCFSSCGFSKNNSRLFIQETVTDCINIIGKNVPTTFLYETEYNYIKSIGKSHENPEVFIELIVKENIVESCNIIFFLSDFLNAKEYYNQLLDYLKNENWNPIQSISKYKLPNGELYSKHEIYFGIYEPTPLTIPICISKDISLNNFYEDSPKMIFDIEYYKNRIVEYKNFFDDRQQISKIIEIDNIIPGFLCFLICWDDNLKGYIYELYAFDKSQNVVGKYLVGYGPKINSYRNVLMEKLPETRIENELIAFGDFNNDGKKEILSYSLYPNMGYVFTVFGYSVLENDFVHLCLVPTFINFDKPFSPVEYSGNGFRILEITNNEPMELNWNNYIWDMEKVKYAKK
jgi:hypothetical protein